MTTEHLDIAPSFEASAKMCILLLERGSDDGQQIAREELIKMGRELDRILAKAGEVMTALEEAQDD